MSTSSQNPTAPSSPGLSPERLAEIRSLLRYESSISFHSARAKESMLLLLAEVEQWRATYGADALPGALTRLTNAEAEVDRLRAELAALESAAFGDAKVRLFTPVDQIRHLHTALARQMARAETVNRIATEQRERADKARTAALNEAVEAARSEYLHDETGTPEDEAYNQGVTDAIAAIGALTDGGAQ